MVLKDRLACARTILEKHNEAASEAINIDAFFAKLRDMGGTSEEALSDATWEDLQECGAPRILARKIANEFRGEEMDKEQANPQKIIVEDNDPVKRAQRLMPGELIAEYDPKFPKNPIGERLKQLAEGQKFLVFQSDDNTTVNVTASQQLFDELDDYGERDDFSVGGIPRKVYKVGDRPGRNVDEHPLFPGTPLRTNGRSEADCDWGAIPLKTRQIYRLAVLTPPEGSGELNVDEFREADLHSEASNRTEEEIYRLYREATIKWQELDDIGQLPSLKTVLGGEKKSKSDPENRPNRPFGQNRTT